ncbi:hypothetical protein HDK77DRAFT_40281 [Phyllosticta capitalensis]
MLPSITKVILRPSSGRALSLIRQPQFQHCRRLLHRQTALFVTGAKTSRIIDVLVGDDAHDSGCVLIDKTIGDEFRAAAAAVDAGGAEMEMGMLPLGFWRAEGRGWFAFDGIEYPRLELAQPLGVCVQGEKSKSAAATLWAFAASDCITLDGTGDDGVARLLRDTEKRLGAVIEQLRDR